MATLPSRNLARGPVRHRRVSAGFLDLNACLDYDCRIGKGAIVTCGSACRMGMVVPDNCIAEGVPARVVREQITDKDRRELMGLVPREWVRYVGERQELEIRDKLGLS